MLDRLVESRSNAQENTRRTGFMLTVFILVSMLMLGGWLYSLFAKDFGMSDDLQLSSLVAPVPVTEDKPPEPEPEKPEEKQQKSQEKEVTMTTRKTNTLAMDESPKVPDKTSTDAPVNKARPKGTFAVSDAPERDATGPPSMNRGDGEPGGGGGGLPVETKKEEPKKEETKTAAAPPPPPPAPPKVPKVISGGVINGKATSLPQPVYPAAARAVGAKGAVNVAVTIDENGNVVSASATSGHPLLKQAAVAAAQRARFAPTKLSGQPVSVKGIIIYNFN